MKTENLHVIIGLGLTGLSCVRFLTKQNIPVVVMDTREAPAQLDSFRQEYPHIPVFTGKQWPQEILNSATRLVVSPGVAVSIPPIQQAKAANVEVVGDIELFARVNKLPLIAITGANGKSTVTALVGEMAKTAGKKVAVLGNIGTPVLNLFENPVQDFDLIVMELSSFQLETTSSLRPLAATVLNITPDHLDRYASFEDYVEAKHRIYCDAQHAIINRQDPLSNSQQIPLAAKRCYFTMDEPQADEFGIRHVAGQDWLAYGKETLLPASALKIVGRHNVANALSALALGSAAQLNQEAMLNTLQHFSGLPHRCQWVGEREGICWINDSKGTNVGATQAALEGIGQQLKGKIVVLLGGDGKGADFTTLSSQVANYCRAIIVMGKDAQIIYNALGSLVETHFVEDMQQAVTMAATLACPGDCVLLSPACASLDQYRDFSHRGEIFMQTVKMVL